MPAFAINTATNPASGNVAVNNVTRDGLIESIQLTNLSDPNTAVCAAVTSNGLATFAPLTSGVPSYYSGTNGMVTIPSGTRVVSIAAASLSGGSLIINSTQTITIQPNSSVSIGPQGNLSAPTLQFVNTSSYIIEAVT
jgi:hypothetical protein